MMADATMTFFDTLAERGHEPLLKSTSGTLRFDLRDGDRVEHWHVDVRKGDVAVSRRNAKADAVVRLDKVLFDRIASGSMNSMAATLRGVIAPEGDLKLVMLFSRLFPGPPRSRKAPAAGWARRQK
jgi:putative sterol carrier protein